MAIPLDEVLPHELLNATRAADVIKFLQVMHVPAVRKREILGQWARQFAVSIAPEEFYRVSR